VSRLTSKLTNYHTEKLSADTTHDKHDGHSQPSTANRRQQKTNEHCLFAYLLIYSVQTLTGPICHK